MYYFVSTATASTSIIPRKWQKKEKVGEESLAEWTSKKKSG
jgi:hypothetical protein